MAGPWIDAPPPTGPPAAIVPPPGGRIRPWWGLWDAVPPLVLLSLSAILALVGELVEPGQGAEASSAELSEQATIITGVVLIVIYLAVTGWPFFVSARKGLGPVKDWGLGFRPVDLAIGVGTGMLAIGAAAVAGAATTALVGLSDASEAENTGFLADAEWGPGLIILLVVVVIAAPVAEELVFRGMTLRALDRRFGPTVAVVGSTIAFTLPHYIGGTLAGTAVLLASIGAVGAVLGAITISVGRLWPAILAHVLLNAVGAAAAVGAFG